MDYLPNYSPENTMICYKTRPPGPFALSGKDLIIMYLLSILSYNNLSPFIWISHIHDYEYMPASCAQSCYSCFKQLFKAYTM